MSVELLTNDRLQQLNTPDLPMLLEKAAPKMLQVSLVNVLRGRRFSHQLKLYGSSFARLETLSKMPTAALGGKYLQV